MIGPLPLVGFFPFSTNASKGPDHGLAISLPLELVQGINQVIGVPMPGEN